MKIIQNKPLAIAFVFLVLLGSAFWLIQPKTQSVKVQQAQDQKLQQIKELTDLANNDPKYREHNSQASRELSDKLCSLTARSAEEREKAVAAVRDFLEMPTVNVKYECNDAFYNLEEDRLIAAKSETYLVDSTYFVVNSVTNHIMQVDETPGTWGYKADGSRWFSDQKQYDNSGKYSQTEIEQLARNFIAKHSIALGSIDLSKLTLETGKKDGGNGRVNYFLTWKGEVRTVQLDPPTETCSEDLDKNATGLYRNDNGVPCIKVYESKEQPSLTIAFTNGGQLINFFNELEGPLARARMR
ncbi:MAG: hypothetical protein BWY24_00322 [Microgenomates group bacterium ADurb.Bin219]|nr:MAG: hypothetical protein BWY24_00322 [Microgenomates group bacterium ADurb.Bin219]